MKLSDLFTKNVILENSIVRLEPLETKHIDALWEIAKDASIWQYTLDNIKSKKDLEQYVQRALKEREDKTGYPFVIIDKRTGNVAGCTRYYEIMEPHNNLEIGYSWMGRSYQGTGLNVACKYEMLKFAFEQLKTCRVALRTDYRNHQSRNAIMKIGAKQEGILRKHRTTPAGYVRDTVYFSILDEDWDAIRKTIFAEFQ